jgi:hypothetical protein
MNLIPSGDPCSPLTGERIDVQPHPTSSRRRLLPMKRNLFRLRLTADWEGTLKALSSPPFL